jgi:hypothetical protein
VEQPCTRCGQPCERHWVQPGQRAAPDGDLARDTPWIWLRDEPQRRHLCEPCFDQVLDFVNTPPAPLPSDVIG